VILKAQSDGYSLVDQEVEVGFRSISVALRRLDGKTIGSLNVGVHSERGPLDTMVNQLLPKLRALADTLQRQLI
jgi:IclR family pca regulon transcriptional regulator